MRRNLIVAPVLLLALTGSSPTRMNAQDDHHDRHYDRHFEFRSGSLVVSRSVYEGKASTITIGETLPLGC